MPQSLSQLWVHLIFSTKKRYPYLKENIVQQRMHDYIRAICQKENCDPIIIGGVEDHVHLLLNVHKNLSISNLVEKIKKSSSKWIKTLNDEYKNELKQFHWQSGYGAFSISLSQLETVKNYIANQKNHHRQQTFQEEFRSFLNTYGITYKEEYVWD